MVVNLSKPIIGEILVALWRRWNFSYCKADPDVWLLPDLKDNGFKYYQHVILHTDDILAMIEESEIFLREELGSDSP